MDRSARRHEEKARRLAVPYGSWSSLDLDHTAIIGPGEGQALVWCMDSPVDAARVAYAMSPERWISAVARGPHGWLLVCTRQPRVLSQRIRYCPSDQRMEWLRERLAEGFSVSSIAEDESGWCVVVMTKGLVWGTYHYHANPNWPAGHARSMARQHNELVVLLQGTPTKWHMVTAQQPGWSGQFIATRGTWDGMREAIRQGWDEQRRVTALSWSRGQYGIVMSSGTTIDGQTYGHYPTLQAMEEGARQQWNKRRVVTGAGYDNSGWVLVWSSLPGMG